MSGIELDDYAIRRTLAMKDDFYHENIFNIILEEVKRQKQIPFTKSFLEACFKDKSEFVLWSASPLFMGHGTLTYQALKSLYTTPTWDHFHRELIPLKQDLSSSQDSWSPEAIKLVLDCMVLLVGQRLKLPGFRAELDHRGYLHPSKFITPMYEECLQQYSSILQTFADRRLEVEGSWLAFL
jgi:hypothetical protein